MKVLIVYATKYGSTVDVAAALADTLRARGHDAVAHAVAAAPAPAGFDAVIVGSGVYMGSWLKPAAAYLEAHATALAERPVWLFGVGPLGAENPQPEGDPEGAGKLVAGVGARGYATFTGALDRGRLSFADRLIARAVKAPEGDFRNWPAIRTHAQGIADALEADALGAPARVSVAGARAAGTAKAYASDTHAARPQGARP